MKKILVIHTMIVLALCSCMDEPENYPNTYNGNFEALWNIIDTRYCYLDYKQIDWDSIHGVYQKQVDTVRTQYSFFNIMANMLNELKDGHVNLYSDFNVSRYWKWFQDYPSNFNDELIKEERYLGRNYLIAGGMKYGMIANSRVGYIYYGDFASSFSDANMAYIFYYFRNCKGIIIDVRNNGGGSLSYSEQLASYFFERDTITGYIQHKTGKGHSDFSSPYPIKTKASSLQWRRPVVVLTNRMSYSATNDFVNRMRNAPKAHIVGDKTGGGGGLPLSSELPNGWLVRFSSCPMLDINKNNTEWGIDPDIQVSLDNMNESKGIDTIIERAIEQILE